MFMTKNFGITLLKGLDSSYESIVSSLITTMSVITTEEFESMLLSYDLRVAAQNQVALSQPLANVASVNNSADVPLTRDGKPAIL